MRPKNDSDGKDMPFPERHKYPHTEDPKDDEEPFRIKIRHIGFILALLLFILLMFFLASQSLNEDFGINSRVLI